MTLQEIIQEASNLTIEELRTLNRAVVDLSKNKQTTRALIKKAELFVGQEVTIQNKSKKEQGTIEKINRTRCVVNIEGKRWDVPISMIV